MHTIIIPHRNRTRELRQTLWAIRNAARVADDCRDYEVLVVDANRSLSWDAAAAYRQTLSPLPLRVHWDDDHPRVFNKPRLLNLGIGLANGELLTFLDADMLVGPGWMHTVHYRMFRVADPPTRLCYRVRQLVLSFPPASENVSHHEETLRCLEHAGQHGTRSAVLADACARARSFAIAAEGYGRPEWTNKPTVSTPVFGNSQWSILRENLGGLLFDEEYRGAGYEDLDMIDAVWRASPAYCGVILVEPQNTLYHLYHGRPSVLGGDWSDPQLNSLNKARYARRSSERRREWRARKQEEDSRVY